MLFCPKTSYKNCMKRIKENKWKIALVLLLILQFLYMIYWGVQKSGYYVDEFFTYDNAHYISESTPERIKLYDADFMKYEEWIDISKLKSTLVVTQNESLLQDSIKGNINAFISKWPYAAVLNYVESIFFEGKLTKWSALSINIVCFLLNQVLIYCIMLRMSRNQTAAFMAMLLYGFSGMAVSMYVYVRMYMWLTFMLSLFSYLHILMWDNRERHLYNLAYESCAMLILFLMYRDSPLPVIYAIGMITGLTIALLLAKRWKQVMYYSIPVFTGGILYAVFKTDYVNIFMNPRKALAEGNLGSAVHSLVSGFVELTPEQFVVRLKDIVHMVVSCLFGHFYVVLLYAIIVAVLIVYYFCKHAYTRRMQVHYNEFIWILLGVTSWYIIMSIAFKLGAIRYNSFVFPEIAMCASALLVYLSTCTNRKYLSPILCGIIIVAEIVFTIKCSRFENLYQNEKCEIEAIESQTGIDSLVVDYHFDDRIMYECLAYADENTQVMFTKYGNTDYVDLPDELLVWQSVNQDSDELIQDLSGAGYNYIDWLASTHESRVFICKRY